MINLFNLLNLLTVLDYLDSLRLLTTRGHSIITPRANDFENPCLN